MHSIESRSKNIVRNTTVSFITQLVLLVLGFGTRTVFINLLGAEYLGLDGLFTSILTIFSLAELGIGNALIFSMYKPLAEGDIHKVQQLLTLYDKAYKWIIVSIIAVGIVLLPFLPKIVNTDLDNLGVNIYVIYLLFLLNTVSSYFLAYRQAILAVNQYQSTISIYQTVGKIVVYSLECLLLLAFGSYYLYLLVRVVGNYVIAFFISKKAEKKYPNLCIKNTDPLPKEEVNRIKKDVYALFIRRVGGVVLSSTDNIVINGYISLSMVGLYSNYVLIVTSIQSITSQVMSAMTASIGNFIATQGKKDTEAAFNLYGFITFLVYGFCSVCFIVLINPFIKLLWGEEYLLSKCALYLIVINFFFWGFQSAIIVFRDTAGLFVQGQYRSIFSAIVNVVSSVILVQFMGLEGVVLGTILSRVFVSAWYDPYILYSEFFKSSPIHFYLKFCFYFVVTFIIAFLLDFLVSMITITWFSFVGIAFLSLLSLPFLVFPFIRTNEIKDLSARVRDIIRKR